MLIKSSKVIEIRKKEIVVELILDREELQKEAEKSIGAIFHACRDFAANLGKLAENLNTKF